jgi:phage shock protein B
MTGVIAVIMSLLGVVAIGIVLALARLMRRQNSSPLEDEARLVQDMYRTLERLENRVEVLETLLAGKASYAAADPDADVRGRF